MCRFCVATRHVELGGVWVPAAPFRGGLPFRPEKVYLSDGGKDAPGTSALGPCGRTRDCDGRIGCRRDCGYGSEERGYVPRVLVLRHVGELLRLDRSGAGIFGCRD